MQPNKLNSSAFFFKLVLGVFLFTFVLGLPLGITSWFDGLPWTGEAETLTLSVIIPSLLILGWRFLSLRLPIIILGILLILKLILFLASPSGGWLVRVITPSINQGQASVDANWVKTYATLWNKNASGILQKPWTEKLDFPLDWALFEADCRACFDALSLTIEVDGALLMPEGNRFALIARGIEEGTLSAVNKDGKSFNLLPAKSFEDAGHQKYQISHGEEWKISGKLKYTGVDWSLVPVMVNADGKISSDLDRGTLWQNKEDLAGSLDYIGLIKILSLILDAGIILFLLAWTTWIARLLVERKILNWPFAICGLMLTCLPIATASLLGELFKILRLSNPGNVNHLGILSVVAGTSFLTWAWRKKDFRNFHTDRIVQSVFLFFGPGILFFFSKKWWSSLGHWKNWGTGDDWTTYQIYARKIVVEGEWLGNSVFTMTPLYRYFVGVYHWLFGQSAFAQNMADVWCILGITIFLSSWAIKLRLPALTAFAASLTYLIPTFLGGFRYQIGRGLVEHHAVIFIALAIWFLYQARDGSFVKIILAGFFGVIGYWIRPDHLPIITLLVFFIIEPTHGKTKEVWRAYWEKIWTYWKRGFTYVGIVAFGVFLFCFRNWWVGGVFGQTVPNHVNWFGQDLIHFYPRIKIMVTAVDHGNPGGATFILLPGTLLGLLALVWRPKFLHNYPIAIGLALFGLFLPYWFVANWGYAPRYSIHLLPLTVMSLIIAGDYVFKRFSKNKIDLPSLSKSI